MSSIGTLGGTLPLAPKSLQVKHQAFPHDGSTGLNWPTPASLPVTDNHHGAGAKGTAGCAGSCENFLIDTGTTYFVLTSYFRVLLPNLYHFGYFRANNYKRFTQALLHCWDEQIFSCQFWWSLSVLHPYWEEIFPAFEIMQLFQS